MFDVTKINTYIEQLTGYTDQVTTYFTELSSLGEELNTFDPKLSILCSKYNVTIPTLPEFNVPDYTYFVPDISLNYDPLTGIDACQITLTGLVNVIASMLSSIVNIIQTAATTVIKFIMDQISTFSTFLSNIDIDKWWASFKESFKGALGEVKNQFIREISKIKNSKLYQKLNAIWNDRLIIYENIIKELDNVWGDIKGLFTEIAGVVSAMVDDLTKDFEQWIKDYRCIQKTFMSI